MTVLQDDSDARHVDEAAVLIHDAGLTRRVGPERERDVLAKPQIPGFLHRSRVGAAEQARIVAVVVADLSKYGRQQHDCGDPVVSRCDTQGVAPRCRSCAGCRWRTRRASEAVSVRAPRPSLRSEMPPSSRQQAVICHLPSGSSMRLSRGRGMWSSGGDGFRHGRRGGLPGRGWLLVERHTVCLISLRTPRKCEVPASGRLEWVSAVTTPACGAATMKA